MGDPEFSIAIALQRAAFLLFHATGLCLAQLPKAQRITILVNHAWLLPSVRQRTLDNACCTRPRKRRGAVFHRVVSRELYKASGDGAGLEAKVSQ